MISVDELRSSFKGQVTTDGDTDYDISRWAKSAVRKAKYVAYPVDAEDVSKAILFARANNLELAICGGRHSTAGASSSEGGLVIDLGKKMNNVRIDAEKQLAYVQGGARWGAVDEASMKHGLVALGGVVSDTGVGGLTVGGGYGWLTGEHGLVVDNLVSATVVIASGEILIASETENADLFWGIRGGGSNFGPVTEFVFKLHKQRSDVYFTELVFASAKLPQILDEVEGWLKDQCPKEATHLAFAGGPDGSPCVVLFGFYNGSFEEGEARFGRFAALGPLLNKTRSLPYPEINNVLEFSIGENRLFRGAFLPKFDKKVISRIDAARQKLVAEYPSTAKSTLVLELYHFGKVSSVPIDATAYPGRHGNSNIGMVFEWSDESLSSQARQISKSVMGDITDEETSGYGNFCDADVGRGKDRVMEQFGSNYTRLAIIKRKYDPENVFHRWFAITPA
ncbi:hypothetical protein BOTBODRAFT_147462 [Botryobasidium botryosum FD-172 SS1]|uniref:FAD-binding PCMH-type domain-containing protein n=1 Tax=Botryobasidium botryosum (strain FD-172 SS1) TaxID=930990 RepID=A0A067M8H8_BOTB1|nr:hypothetical protein BOTBODRAFT_147462 [Botryobasidium botryosum FD-172 SS1]